jgi:transcriptional regulator with XRE-family HTH domain
MRPRINDNVYYEPADAGQLQRDFGAWVQDARTLRGISQSTLAKRMKISRNLYQNDISMIERGVKPIDLEMIVGICQALQVTDNEFTELINWVFGTWVTPIERRLDASC